MKPETVFRIGSVRASVFVNEIVSDSGKRTFRTVAIQRCYRDDSDGEWKSSNSFGLGELPQAITALDLAMKHVADKESAVAT